jgi:predicted ester cyclase
MDSRETRAFAERLMLEVWEPLDVEAVPRFYNHRKQQLNYEDVVHRLVADKPRYANPTYDIRDIVAEVDKFAIRFLFVATGPSGQSVSAEANYFYHLKDDKVSEFLLLADIDFDYRADV